MRRHNTICLLQILTLIVLSVLMPAIAPAEERYSTRELLGLSMEELMNIKVVSVSKREEQYYDTAAATFIITNDDIRRAGARSIPEALRLAPGVEVNRVNANQYAIAIRGQNDLFSDKLLVLMDGRSLYTPTTSGVYWIAQNYPMEDIERIEVIRGPSGAIWGANAVNGVINIITKSAHSTSGAYISAGGGIEETGFANMRVSTNTDKAAFRAYVMKEDRDGGIYPVESEQPAAFPGGTNAPDSRKLTQGGFRSDWIYDDRTDISVHGDIYNVKAGAFGTYVPQPFVAPQQPYVSTHTYRGHNLTSQIEHRFADESSMKGQLYYDQYHFDTISYGERRNTYDVDLQYNSRRLLGNLISVGANYRNSASVITDKPTLQMPDATLNIVSLFVNDDFELIEDRFHIIAGVKFEKSSYMSWQTQPHLRTIYTGDNWSLWASASHAVRSPNMAEASVTANVVSGPGFVARGVGNGGVDPEKVESYEAGIRFFPKNFLFQLTAFRMNYRGISDLNNTLPADIIVTPGGVIYPYYFKNVLDGKVEGLEADFTFKLNKWAKFKGTYTFLHQSYRPVAALTNNTEALFTVQSTLKQSPKNRYTLGLSLDPLPSVELDLNLYGWSLYRNDGFGPINPSTGARRMVNSYNRLDARIGWQATDHLNISLVGQNLLKAAHREDVDSTLEFSSLVQQAFYAKAEYRF